MVEVTKYEPLREDGELILYRGRTADGQPELLVLSFADQHPSQESLKRLENEYSLREELDPAWAARPIRIAPYGDQTVLLLQDPGGIPLDRLIGPTPSASSSAKTTANEWANKSAKSNASKQPLEIALFLRVAISVSAAIGALHQRGIIHKNINPTNVLVDWATGQCWLTGFGIASRLPRERQPPGPPEFIAGTLAYMAPEQTGRMNRSIDSRSDLYSVGVMLYELLTGTLPFSATDPMEWVHCHIARQPLPPDTRSKTIPAPVSDIVMKLLAKTAEERYQTAAGVESDLRRCLNEWEGSSGGCRIRHNRSSGAASEMQGSSMATADPHDPRLQRAGIRLRQSAGETTSYTAATSDPAAAGRVLPSDQGNAHEPMAIDPFPLGEHDTPDRLQIPEKLYGRDREIETLLTSFDRVIANGKPELVLVSGYSGIGKSSVVNELHPVLVPPRGLFASGKFDQYKRNIPYSTLAQALQNLVRLLLSKSTTELDIWRANLREALGQNAQLMVDLVPELAFIIGEQPQPPDLPPSEAKRRFQILLRRFIGVFAQPEHPLALFLDDLQWLDAATLDFLEDLLAQSEVRHLMLIGAYRDNEVDITHPLWRRLEAIRQAGSVVREIVLAPLDCRDLVQMIVDCLHCEPERAISLAQLVQEKTGGNPFFAVQFISALAEEGLLKFDREVARWNWDLHGIHAKGYTDNVVDLMLGKLNRLPVETQQALELLACLGNRAEFSRLAMVHQDSRRDLHADLWEAVRAGLVLKAEDAYRFLHDRV